MANSPALSTLGGGYGPIVPGLGVKNCIVTFSVAASGDILIFDASNVGKENAMSKITFALCWNATTNGATTVVYNTLSGCLIASNQITLSTIPGAGTTITAMVWGIGA